jgi:tetratricopeptide (TPR) repeat protein
MSISQEFERAFRLHQQGKLREAFMRYDAVLAADPDNAPALHYSGVVLFQAGKLPEAAERIRASLAIEPKSPDAWSNLALVLNAAGRREAAANALREAATLAPASPEILANLSAAELALGRTAEAEAFARRAIAADATHAPAWHNLALSLEPQGRLLEAMDASSRATAQAPAEPAYAGFKAQLESTAGMRKKARTTLDSALARKPESAPLQFQLAGLLERENDPSGAMQAYANVVRLDPRHGAALSQLLFLRQRVGDWHDLKTLRTQFQDGVAAGTPLLSPFVLLSQPSSRHEQLRCATGWTAVLAPAANQRRRASCATIVCASAICRPTSTRMPPHILRRVCSRRTIGRASRSSRIRRARTIAVRCAIVSCAGSTGSSMPPAGLRCGSRNRFATMASTYSSISRATRRARRRPCSRCARHRSRSTTWGTREHSAAISSTT